MANINVLPEHLINQIAAGEVVERPASVVKELVENSIDAGATKITVEVHGAGDSFMRITDDGSGMDKEDANLAFERHATSKITTADDLTKIHTLGFRGEAIASIASVSYFTLQTKKKGALEGTLIQSEGGKMTKKKDLGCPEGTQIEVRQLFYNTPARKKYLKNDSTEYGHILDTLTGIALANHTVGFRLVRDDKVAFDLPATEERLVRARDLLGRQVADELIPVFYGHSQIQLEGYIGKPLIARANRKGQHLFVNGREVSSHVLSYAVKQAYHSLLPKEKNPVFLLFLTVDPELVDVNVHPRKLEVRFADEKEVFKIFMNASKKALEKHVLAPSFSPQDSMFHNEREHQNIMKVEDKPLDTVKVDVPASVVSAPPAEPQEKTESQPGPEEPQTGWNLEPSTEIDGELTGNSSAEQTIVEREGTDELIPLAQMDNSYILCQQGRALIVVDQHAAHERVRYTEILDEFEKRQKAVQPLLTPEQLELSPQEAALLEDNKELLQDMGFEIEPFGGNTFSVFGVPSYLVKEDVLTTLRGLIDDLNNQAVKGDLQARKEKALTYAACRSAVKFGDPLSKEEMDSLCKRLMELDLPYTCPHGRPTMFTMTFDELEKKFGRDYKG